MNEAAVLHSSYGTVPVVERLLSICRNDPNDVPDIMQVCLERTTLSATTRQDRPGTAASAIYLGVDLSGIGDLFGFIPSDAPVYDSGLAAEGRAR